MESDFQSCSLADIYDFASGLSKARSEFGEGHPFLGFKDVFYNSAVPKELKELVRSTEQERVKCSVRRGDVFLTRTSETMNELGMSCVALNDIPFATFNGFTKRLRPKNEGVIAPEYARYYFRSWAFRSEVNSMATMSTRASLNNEILSRLSISFPPLEEQQAIGNILGTLDEKIELNRKINETLEGIAKALFKSWFIDFDPVRAMEEGRPTGLPDEISELFSDSFEQSELGEIPSGWTFEKASDLYQVTIGKTPPRKESWWFSDSDQDIPWLSIKDMGNAFVYAMETSEYLTRDAVNTFNVRIVPRGAVLVSFKLTVGRVAIAPSEMLTNEAIAHFAPLGESIPASYSY